MVEERLMNMFETPPDRPEWNPDKKRDSAVNLGAWMNELARLAFLEDGHHPDMFSFVSDSGELHALAFKNASASEKVSAIADALDHFQPFATFHTRLAKTGINAETERYNYDVLELTFEPDSEAEDWTYDCLTVEVAFSSSPDKVLYLSKTSHNDDYASLEDTTVYSTGPDEVICLGDCDSDYTAWCYDPIDDLASHLRSLFDEDAIEAYGIDYEEPHPAQMAEVLAGVEGLEHLTEKDIAEIQTSLECQYSDSLNGSSLLGSFSAVEIEQHSWGGDAPGHSGSPLEFYCKRKDLPAILKAINLINTRLSAICDNLTSRF